jgi:hypothetical protein
MFTLANCRFRYADEHSDISAYNLIFLKDFIKTVAFSINEADNDSNLDSKTV